jgi:ABC-type oligopeptide transport system ATPase subunit
VVERGPTDTVLSRPVDEYTIRLLEDVPKLTALADVAPADRAVGIPAG